MQKALLLTNGLLATDSAKTAHGLIRETNRYSIVGVVDHLHAGKDAGEMLDGKHRNIPVFSNVPDAVAGTHPDICIVGVATLGGVFPGSLLDEVVIAIHHKLSVVNGLHDLLNEREDIAALAAANGVTLLDIRKPKKTKDLHFWTGKIKALTTAIVAVIGTDCGLGKRTTTRFLVNTCTAAGISAQMIYTGQTGWLQGNAFGFVLDSTPNDFVSGELEHAILSCQEQTQPEIIFIEGQSALRNPSGPCGPELLLSGNARSVVLVHSPKRKYFDHDPLFGNIPSIQSEIELIRLYGSTVIAIALNTEQCSLAEAKDSQTSLQQQFQIPVLLPLEEGCEQLLPKIRELIG